MNITVKIIKTIAAVVALIMLASCTVIEIIPTKSTDSGNKTLSSPTKPRVTKTSETVDVPPQTDTNIRPGEPARVSFVAAGDNIIHDAVREDAAKRAGEGSAYNFLPMYQGIASTVSSADLSFINMECPVAGASFGYSGYPYFNAPEESVQALIDVGFDVFNINNNHMLDKGTAALASTINYFKSLQSILMIGGYNGEEDLYTPRTVTINGIKIGFISLNYGSNIETIDPSYGITVPFYKTKNWDGSYSVDNDFIRSYVSSAAKTCDFLIASVHWGDENTYTVNDEQKNVAALISESGADVIIGHHPHVIQSVEWHQNSDSSKTLVVYSLGNFISTQYYDYNMIGGMMSFDIVRDESGNVSVESPTFIPTITHYSMNRDSLQVYLLENYSEDLAKTHGCLLHSTDFTYAKAISSVKYVIPREFLSDFYK